MSLTPQQKNTVQEALTALATAAVEVAEHHVKRQLRGLVRRRIKSRVVSDALFEALR